MIPPKLKPGDKVRVVAPSRSLSIISKETRANAVGRLESLGFKVTFSKHVEEADDFKSSSIKSRVADLHDAFSDRKVKMILPVIGGFNCNQLLRCLDWELIKKNPKIIGGYSDTTALQNAIHAKTSLVTYSTPSFSTFGMKKGFDYTLEYFKKCLMQEEPYEVKASAMWSDDPWYKDQDKREFLPNKGFTSVRKGTARGKLIGGNLCTLNLLQGTEFMPSLKDTILFIEDDYESKAVNFDRDLQSLIHQPGFEGVKGIVIGRFQKASEMTDDLLRQIIETKEELKKIPVIIGADFGHTDQIISFPIGGECEIASGKETSIRILKH